MKTRLLQRSLAGGEMSPEMFGRADDARYQTGAATFLNYIARPQGPAENRAGFKYVNAVKDSSKLTRLIPFTYSTDQTMIIELSENFIRFHTMGATLLDGGSPYQIASTYQEEELFDIHYVQSADVLTLVHPNHVPRELRRLGATNWTLTDIAFGSRIATPTGLTVVASGHTADKYDYEYTVTAFHEDGIGESEPATAVEDAGNLLETGGIVTISWTAVAGASKYRVYKYQGGIYGYIGETETTEIVDDNIAPDLGISPPTYEDVFDAADDYPGAVSYFEQRRCFAGTDNAPQKFWMTKSGTESDMSYSIPIKDSDRIAYRVAAREANRIRHIIPMNDLLLMTSSVEWRVTSVNSDAITPNTVSVRPQSFVGASNVQPVIINNSLVFGAARGGHLREMGYNFQANGYITGDLCLRSTHLFDNHEITQMAYSKAPDPIIWMVSSSGLLLGLTYIPEQQIGSWHKHDSGDGVFESCAVVSEGIEDHLYVVVRRVIDGSTVRYIERMETRHITTVDDMFFVDSGGTYDGRNTSATTMTLSGGTSWESDETLTLTASTAEFVFPTQSDVDDVIEIRDSDGNKYRLTIEATTSTSVATVRTDNEIPASLQSTATTEWSFARNVITGIDWLEGETVNLLVDGAVHPQKVVTSGEVTLDRPASVVQVGLPIVADINTLPVIIGTQDGSFAQGRVKNLNEAWIRVFESSGIFAGPSAEKLVEYKQRTTEPYGSPVNLKTGEVSIVLKNSWNDSGQLFIRQSDPLPLTIIGITYEVQVGE